MCEHALSKNKNRLVKVFECFSIWIIELLFKWWMFNGTWCFVNAYGSNGISWVCCNFTHFSQFFFFPYLGQSITKIPMCSRTLGWIHRHWVIKSVVVLFTCRNIVELFYTSIRIVPVCVWYKRRILKSISMQLTDCCPNNVKM